VRNSGRPLRLGRIGGVCASAPDLLIACRPLPAPDNVAEITLPFRLALRERNTRFRILTKGIGERGEIGRS
jgi:hypothetical protein